MSNNFNDFNFEDPLFKHLKSTIDKVPQKFLQYDNRSKNIWIQIFISEVGKKYLSESDFEHAVRKALKHCFPQIKLRVCQTVRSTGYFKERGQFFRY